MAITDYKESASLANLIAKIAIPLNAMSVMMDSTS
jgi:hypothetical protein